LTARRIQIYYGSSNEIDSGWSDNYTQGTEIPFTAVLNKTTISSTIKLSVRDNYDPINNVQSKSFRILVSKPGTQEVIADLRGTCSGIFVTSTSTEQPTPMPAVVEITATPTHAPPSGSPYAFVPIPTPPTAGEKPTAPPAPTPPSVKPTAAATRTPFVAEKAAAPDYTFLALGLAFLALVAAYYFKKKSRPEPKSLSYVARQRKRL
jgi:hypothetical protein